MACSLTFHESSPATHVQPSDNFSSAYTMTDEKNSLSPSSLVIIHSVNPSGTNLQTLEAAKSKPSTMRANSTSSFFRDFTQTTPNTPQSQSSIPSLMTRGCILPYQAHTPQGHTPPSSPPPTHDALGEPVSRINTASTIRPGRRESQTAKQLMPQHQSSNSTTPGIARINVAGWMKKPKMSAEAFLKGMGIPSSTRIDRVDKIREVAWVCCQCRTEEVHGRLSGVCEGCGHGRCHTCKGPRRRL